MTWSSDVRNGLTESLLPFVILLLVLVVAFGMLSRKIFPSQSSESCSGEGEGEDENAKEKKQKVKKSELNVNGNGYTSIIV